MLVSLIPTDHLASAWKEAAPILERAVRRAKENYKIEDLYDEIKNGDLNLWMIFGDDPSEPAYGALTTGIKHYPRRSMVGIGFLAGTRMSEWADLLNDTLAKYADDVNCDGVELTGRDGWARSLERLGWKKTHIVMERTIHG